MVLTGAIVLLKADGLVITILMGVTLVHRHGGVMGRILADGHSIETDLLFQPVHHLEWLIRYDPFGFNFARSWLSL